MHNPVNSGGKVAEVQWELCFKDQVCLQFPGSSHACGGASNVRVSIWVLLIPGKGIWGHSRAGSELIKVRPFSQAQRSISESPDSQGAQAIRAHALSLSPSKNTVNCEQGDKLKWTDLFCSAWCQTVSLIWYSFIAPRQTSLMVHQIQTASSQQFPTVSSLLHFHYS